MTIDATTVTGLNQVVRKHHLSCFKRTKKVATKALLNLGFY